MGLRYGQGKYGTFKYGPAPAGFQYRVEIADTSGTLLARLNNQIRDIEWSYSDAGGCDELKMYLKRQSDDFSNLAPADKAAQYDIKLYIVPSFGESSVLFWRGQVFDIRPALRDDEEIYVLARGYSYRLNKLQVQDGTGAPVTFENTTIEDIVDSLADDYAVAQAGLTKGTIDSFGVSVTSMKFGGTVRDAIQSLADIVDAEWGVDRNKTFFFLKRSSSIGYRFRIGYDISEMQDEYDYEDMINRIIIEGGDVDGVPFRYVATFDKGSFDRSDIRVSNSSVFDDNVALSLAKSIYNRKNSYSRNTSVTLPRNTQLLEVSTPMPLAVIDQNPKTPTYKYGTFKYGQKTYSGQDKFIIRKIYYHLNDVSIETEIEFNFGKPSVGKRMEQIEFELDQVRQKAGV